MIHTYRKSNVESVTTKYHFKFLTTV